MLPLYRAIPLALLATWLISTGTVRAAGEQPLTVDQIVEMRWRESRPKRTLRRRRADPA